MTVKDFIYSNVRIGTILMTDEHRSYSGIGADFAHHAVNHLAGEYVRHFVLHTNTIEVAWSLFKRQVYGIHHHVSPKHVGAYLAEMCYRHNRRAMGEGDRVNDLLGHVEGRLTYKALTHAEADAEVR